MKISNEVDAMDTMLREMSQVSVLVVYLESSESLRYTQVCVDLLADIVFSFRK